MTLLCCLGSGPLIALLSAITAGFIVNDVVLALLLVVSLVIGGIGLGAMYRRHRRKGSLLAHISGAVAVYAFAFVLFSAPFAWLGLVGLSLHLFGIPFWGSEFTKHAVEQTGIKEIYMENLICYCFNYTVSDIEDDVRRNGQSTIVERILSEKKSGGCRCAEKNPKGR